MISSQFHHIFILATVKQKSALSGLFSQNELPQDSALMKCGSCGAVCGNIAILMNEVLQPSCRGFRIQNSNGVNADEIKYIVRFSHFYANFIDDTISLLIILFYLWLIFSPVFHPMTFCSTTRQSLTNSNSVYLRKGE